MSNVTFQHAHDHALVNLHGYLDWDAAFSLVDTLDTMVETYFYTTIEMVVSSPGGDNQAMHYCLARLDRLATEGVHLRTRALSLAASAAAVIVSSGDERVVEPGAFLVWHGAQLRADQQADARTTAALASALTAADERMVDRLVSGALATSSAERPPHRAEPSDRRVLEYLARVHRANGGTKVPKKIRKLARVVGGVVDRAVRDADREALANVYRRLFELDASVSAHLALTLRLVDRVGAAAPEETARPFVDGLVVPEWRALYPPDGMVPRDALTRHTLVLGETGSGKTASCILPVVAAMAAAPRERLGGGLVIDPKRELAEVLKRMAPERLHHVTVDNAVLKVMAGPRWSLDDDLASSRWLSAARRILCRVASFCPGTPARTLMDHEVSNANTEFFDREGTSLAMTLLAFLLMLLDERTPPPETWLEDDVEAFAWADDLLERARGPDGPNALALLGWVLDGPLMSSPSSRGGMTFSLDDGQARREPPPEWLFTRLARAALSHLCTAPGEGRDLCGRIVDYWTPMVDIDRQYAGVRATATSVCTDFASPSIARSLYFGCEPGYRVAREGGRDLDFARLVAPHGPGTMVLFQPARDGQDALVAIALKAAFFEAVLDDPDRARGGPHLPLVAYVADEFHRFVSSDPLHGEQSFLDTCRSFGAVCVLACQSIASIQHALAHGAGSWDQNGAAVEILGSNTASKLVFRSTDPEVASRVSELSPHRPGLPGVVRVRPVSTLAPGECYASLADGRFERRQLGRFRVESADEADAHYEAGASPDAGDDEAEASPDADAVEPEPVPTAGVVELEASPAVGVPEPEAAPVVLVGAFEPAGGES